MTRILTTILVLALAVTGLFANDCDAPTGLQAQNTTDGVLLSWNAATNAQSYRLKVENANNNPQLFEIEITVNGTSHLVTGLNANAFYKFKVRTVCSGDKSDWTSYVPFQTALAGGSGTGGGGNTGGGVTGVCTIPEGLVVSNVTGTEATLSWNAVAGVSQYEVEVEDNENTPLFAFNTLTSETTVTVTGLSPNGQYQFKVKSKCSGGLSSDYSAWVFFNTGTGTGGNTGGNTGGGNTGGGTGGTCGIPAGLSVSDLTGTSAVLSWSPVAGALKYEVEVEDDENTPLFTFNAITSDTTIAVIGLSPGGSYQFKVKSKCDGSLSSDYSGWVFFGAGITGGGNTGGGGGTGGSCAVPANLQSLQITTTSALLTWSPVAGVLKYEVEVEDDENTIAFSFNALTADTAVLIIGLTPGGNYQFKVKSKCGGGMSSDYTAWNFFSTATQLVAPATGSAGLPSNSAVHTMSAFRVFPNPATSEVAVQLDEPATAPLSVTVMNAQGRQMMRYNGLDGNGGRIDLPVSNLDSGLYVVVISDGQSMQSQQLLIAR